ncbi:MAG: hypothetical protein J0I98_05005 [Mesorhizobium sp.]|nr:hypothetical protein [Mesorhizobium sp.]MBN9242132.1 hypothetical protein [Mesorhizobium sp.]
MDWQIIGVRRKKRAAKKAGNLADFMDAEAEIKRLKKLYAAANDYEREFRDIKAQAHAWHEKASGTRTALRDALEKHVSAIMDEPDFTMEGIIIKAQALAEWDRVGTRWGDRLAIGREWHSQLAASILRYAKGGAA